MSHAVDVGQMDQWDGTMLIEQRALSRIEPFRRICAPRFGQSEGRRQCG
jgi:hypothetical protein